MWKTIQNAFKVPDIRNKLLFTLFIILIFRIGSAIPVPFIDATALKNFFNGAGGEYDYFNYINLMTGDALSKATIFSMSITPFINASIIMNLLTVAITPLGRLAKEGEEGRKKINAYTRYLTVVIALVQATAFYFILRNGAAGTTTGGIIKSQYMTGFASWFVAIVIIALFTAGAAIIMWLGEQINEKGLGNGISMILFAGIISRGPAAFDMLRKLWLMGSDEPSYYIIVPVIVVLFVLIIAGIVVITEAERRIPIQYAQRVVGRKMYGGQSSYFPIKVNMSGVMPIIFASSFMSLPGMIRTFFNIQPGTGGFWNGFFQVFSYQHPVYAVLFFILIMLFNFFYVQIQYNPIEIANNLRKNNGAIHGIRPGKPTSDYIAKILFRITFIGAIFLGIIAVFPIFSSMAIPAAGNLALGGTSVLILVGVALETVRTLESSLMMRHHKGFLE